VVSERLQKILARAGYGSRRSAEALIAAGRVRVNGRVVTEAGTKADAATDVIEVDGKRIAGETRRVYLAMHKPAGVVTTAVDPQKRRTVMELLPDGLPPHVLPVGRLDRDTEGLLLFTNDGELAHRLAHPRYRIDKEYAALVEGHPSARALSRLRRGIEIEGRMTAPAEAEIVPDAPPGYRQEEGRSWLRIVIHEGRKRQVRLMCEAIGHPVRRLVRVRIGDVRLGSMRRGSVRELRAREVAALRRAVGLEADAV
jgi:23S rRNA pseudouridine2605 synthase